MCCISAKIRVDVTKRSYDVFHVSVQSGFEARRFYLTRDMTNLYSFIQGSLE